MSDVNYVAALPALSYVATTVPDLAYVAQSSAFFYTASIPGNRMPALNDLPAIAPAQIETLAADFGFFLPPGVTLTGAPTFTVTDENGIDTNPSHILSGPPTIGTAAPPSGSGVQYAAVLQQVKQCVAGANYLFEVTCQRSDGLPIQNVAEGYFHMPCVAPS